MQMLRTRQPARNGINLQRPNKTARGMTETLERRFKILHAYGPAFGLSAMIQRADGYTLRAARESVKAEMILSVRGTFDRCGAAWIYRTERAPCGCCGCKCRGKIKLNVKGRSRLRALRSVRALRAQFPNEPTDHVARIRERIAATDRSLRV